MSKKGSIASEEPQRSGWLFSASAIVTMWLSQVCYYAANRLAKVVWKHLQTDASELYTFIQANSKQPIAKRGNKKGKEQITNRKRANKNMFLQANSKWTLAKRANKKHVLPGLWLRIFPRIRRPASTARGVGEHNRGSRLRSDGEQLFFKRSSLHLLILVLVFASQELFFFFSS